ncbi:helix-turn-helix domain-containing protein [Fonticella tunisiensis]|uniref:Excisionase family DNA binding protein n=1 Tax=Fonticella tunisiensis TaxID=1096341 RepID=A0A4R7KWN6_9CLOT|nr:helix-turn-helix domain-containing protein [Fonticella tunisiensis]TDT63390.1 excisionase family DNA binding protein [Fonticella tunisiensis]
METKVYKVDEVAQMLRCGKTSIYEMIRQKKLKCIRVGRKILIPEMFIEEFLSKGGELS